MHEKLKKLSKFVAFLAVGGVAYGGGSLVANHVNTYPASGTVEQLSKAEPVNFTEGMRFFMGQFDDKKLQEYSEKNLWKGEPQAYVNPPPSSIDMELAKHGYSIYVLWNNPQTPANDSLRVLEIGNYGAAENGFYIRANRSALDIMKDSDPAAHRYLVAETTASLQWTSMQVIKNNTPESTRAGISATLKAIPWVDDPKQREKLYQDWTKYLDQQKSRYKNHHKPKPQ